LSENNGGEDNKYECKFDYFCFMEINEAMIDKLASLSKLDFNPSEKKELIADLQNMLMFVNKLQSLDTDNVEPLLYITDNKNILRADEINSEINRDQALQNARMKDEQFFKVPKVIKKS
jgi:aspartyl-tRNA(Asn)/glutamyl-tRNA(Gln) amidotransferase subunit C